MIPSAPMPGPTLLEHRWLKTPLPYLEDAPGSPTTPTHTHTHIHTHIHPLSTSPSYRTPYTHTHTHTHSSPPYIPLISHSVHTHTHIQWWSGGRALSDAGRLADLIGGKGVGGASSVSLPTQWSHHDCSESFYVAMKSLHANEESHSITHSC